MHSVITVVVECQFDVEGSQNINQGRYDFTVEPPCTAEEIAAGLVEPGIKLQSLSDRHLKTALQASFQPSAHDRVKRAIGHREPGPPERLCVSFVSLGVPIRFDDLR